MQIEMLSGGIKIKNVKIWNKNSQSKGEGFEEKKKMPIVQNEFRYSSFKHIPTFSDL